MATLPVTGAPFGTFTLAPLLTDEQPYQGPATPHSLSGVSVGSDVKALLKDPAVRKALLRHGFVIVPSDMPRFSAAYDSQAYTGTPVFMTTDAAYDAWHLVFDKVLRSVETKALLPRLEELVTGMLANARRQASDLQGTALAKPANRIVTLLKVAGSELGLKVGALSGTGRAELELINAHDGLTRSPLLGTDIDYSLYTPRGHYTRTKALTRYFVAMSVLGQTAFALPGALQNDLSRADDSGLRLGALAARTLVGDEKLEGLWRDIYEPTAFLVGLSDDYTPFELATAIESAQPGTMADPAPLAQDATIELDRCRAHGGTPGADRPRASVCPPDGNALRAGLVRAGPVAGAERGDRVGATPPPLAAGPGGRVRVGLRLRHPARCG